MRRLSTPRQIASCLIVPANMSLLFGGFGTRREEAQLGPWGQPSTAPDSAPQKHSPLGRRFSGGTETPCDFKKPRLGPRRDGAGRRLPQRRGQHGGSGQEKPPGVRPQLRAVWIRSGSRARSRHCSESDGFISRVSETPGAQKGGEECECGKPAMFAIRRLKSALWDYPARSTFRPSLPLASFPSPKFESSASQRQPAFGSHPPPPPAPRRTLTKPLGPQLLALARPDPGRTRTPEDPRSPSTQPANC